MIHTSRFCKAVPSASKIAFSLPLIFTLVVTQNSLAQQPPAAKVEARGCNEQSSPLPTFHPHDSIKLCATFAADLDIGTTAYVNLQWQGPEPADRVIPNGSKNLEGQGTASERGRQIEIIAHVPDSAASGVFILNTLNLQTNPHSVGTIPLDERDRVKVTVENPGLFTYPKLQTIAVQPSKP